MWLIQSGDDDYLTNETRMKPTTWTRCLTPLRAWHGMCVYTCVIGLRVHVSIYMCVLYGVYGVWISCNTYIIHIHISYRSLHNIFFIHIMHNYITHVHIIYFTYIIYYNILQREGEIERERQREKKRGIYIYEQIYICLQKSVSRKKYMLWRGL